MQASYNALLQSAIICHHLMTCMQFPVTLN